MDETREPSDAADERDCPERREPRWARTIERAARVYYAWCRRVAQTVTRLKEER